MYYSFYLQSTLNLSEHNSTIFSRKNTKVDILYFYIITFVMFITKFCLKDLKKSQPNILRVLHDIIHILTTTKYALNTDGHNKNISRNSYNDEIIFLNND